MKHLYIAVLQQKHVNYHFLVHHAPIEENWKISGEGRNELKKVASKKLKVPSITKC